MLGRFALSQALLEVCNQAGLSCLEASFATTAAEALRMVREQPDTFEQIILDFELPDMSCEALLTELQSVACDETGTVVIAKHIRSTGMKSAFRAGACAVLIKPLQLSQVQQIGARRLCGRQRLDGPQSKACCGDMRPIYTPALCAYTPCLDPDNKLGDDATGSSVVSPKLPPLPLNADPASGPSSMPLPHPEQPCKPIETSKQIDPKRPIPNVRLGRPIHPDMDEVSTICAQQ